jgi:hypothetical protein
MSLCTHFASLDGIACKRGVNLRQLAGGGVFTMPLRLPCYPLSNRQGEVAKECKHYEPSKETA